MKNLKIQSKLFVGFGIVLMLIIVLGIAAFFSNKSLNKTISDFTTIEMPSTKDILMMRRHILSIQRYVLGAMLQTDPKLVEEAATGSDTDAQKLLDTFAEYKKIAEIDKTLISNLEAKLNEAAPYRRQIVDLASINTEETNAQALVLYNTEYFPRLNDCITLLLQMADAQDAIAAEKERQASSTSASAMVIIFIVLAASILISIIITFVITRAITRPVNEAENAAREIAAGNFNVNLRVTTKDEIGKLTESFIKVRDTIVNLVEKINYTSNELNNGDLDARIDEAMFDGEYKATASAVNGIIGSYAAELRMLLAAYGEFGNGNFNSELKKLPGKKAIANQSFDSLKSNLKSVSGDVTTLINGAMDGKLSTRVDASKYNGDWRKLTEGLNELLQAISQPIDDANDVLKELSAGNFSVSVNKNYKGSFGAMMKSFDSMVTSTGSYINEITDILDTISQSDLRKNITREYVGQFNMIKEAINKINKTLRETISEIRTSADNVLAGAKQISETSMDLANGASNQASAIQELNASIAVINNQTHENSDKTKSADELSQKSISSAQKGNQEMTKMLQSMDDIKQASNNISKIIKVIDEIAFQTNLLALNASVEAARAGEQGKGFAVVAEEVRSLAGRSLKAASDTSTMIEDTIAKINSGTELASLTSDALKTIIGDIDSISNIINEIYRSTNEQADGIAQINIGINQISDVVQTNSSTSEESAAAAEELNSQSEVLAQMVSNFKI